VSIVLTTAADGTIPVPPLVVHEGGGKDTLPGNLVHGLQAGDFIAVTCSESGYCDHDAFSVYKELLLKRYDGAAADKPRMLFLDGYDSHFEPESMRDLMDNDVSAFFLQSHSSIVSQPNDNGPNAVLEQKFSEHYSQWRLSHPNVPLLPCFFNEIFRTAFADFRADPHTKEVIIHAFKKTNLHPLRDVVEELQQGGELDEASLQKVAGGVALSQSFCSDAGDQQQLLRIQSDVAAVRLPSLANTRDRVPVTPPATLPPLTPEIYLPAVPPLSTPLMIAALTAATSAVSTPRELIASGPVPSEMPHEAAEPAEATPSSQFAALTLSAPTPDAPPSEDATSPTTLPLAAPIVRSVMEEGIAGQPHFLTLGTQLVGPSNPMYKTVITQAAWKAHLESHVIPAQRLQDVLNKDKAMKAVKLKRKGRKGTNPDTTTGLGMSGEVLVEITHSAEHRAEMQARKIAAREEREERNVRLRQVNRSNYQHLLEVARSGDDDWQKLNLSLIKSACAVLLTSSELRGLTRKGQYIAALQPALQARLQEEDDDDEGSGGGEDGEEFDTDSSDDDNSESSVDG
jgi:hypothetical protein